jgi:hypothetical protein
MPGIFSCLLPSLSVTYGLQGSEILHHHVPNYHNLTNLDLVLALISVPLQSEKFFDFCGALGWISTTYVSLYYPFLKAKYWDCIPGIVLPSISSFAPRQLLLTAALALWTLRLGTSLTKVCVIARVLLFTKSFACSE